MKKILIINIMIIILLSLIGCKAKKEDLLIQVEIIGEGTLLPEPNKTTYQKGENVKITAIPAENYIFAEYVIDGEIIKNNPTEIQLLENTKVKVVFYKKDDYRTINITVNGDGIVKKTPDKKLYEKNENVYLIAQPGINWEFVRWEGDITGNESTKKIITDTNKEIIAVFKPYDNYYVLRCNKEGEGYVNRSPLKTSFKPDEIVTITANPKYGWYFSHWEGDLSGTDNPVSIQLTKDTTVKAIFKEKDHTINININGGGYVTKFPDKEKYKTGETVTLTANPETGWIFDKWGGYLQGNELSKTITVNEDINVTAFFRDKVNIKVDKSDTNQPVVATCPDKINVGDTLEIDLKWIYTSGGITYYLKTDGVTINPSYTYNLGAVQFNGQYANQKIYINNVKNDLDININIGEYFKIETVACRPPFRTVIPSSVVTIKKTPEPSHTVYGVKGLYKKGDTVSFKAIATNNFLIVYELVRWEPINVFGGSYINNPISCTINESTTIEAWYEEHAY